MSDSESIRATHDNEMGGERRSTEGYLYVSICLCFSSFCTLLPDSQGYPEFSVECI